MILRGNVFSQTLGMDTGLSVIGPDKLQPGESYKVAYLLHGLCGNHDSWADNTMLRQHAQYYHTLFVMPDAARSFYIDMKYGYSYFTYITEELPEIVRSVFQVSPGREDTAVIGASMGGYGALRCAFAKPEQYGYCMAFSSGSLFLKDYLGAQRESGHPPEIPDFRMIFGDDLHWQPDYEITELAKSALTSGAPPSMYLACGESDPLYPLNLQLHRVLDELGYTHKWVDGPGDHSWKYFDRALERALRWCYQ